MAASIFTQRKQALAPIEAAVRQQAVAFPLMDLAVGSGREMFADRSLSRVLSPSALHDWPDPPSELVQSDFLDKKDVMAAKLIPTAITGNMRIASHAGMATHHT
jgi:hypothetical protein